MNVELLEKVARHIEANPDQFNMDWWLNHEHQTSFNKIRKMFGMMVRESCTTTGCIAGWAYLLGNDKDRHELLEDYLGGKSYEYYPEAMFLTDVSKLLGVESPDALFYKEYWPPQFKEALYNATTTAEAAAVSAARIRHFVATEGKE